MQCAISNNRLFFYCINICTIFNKSLYCLK